MRAAPPLALEVAAAEDRTPPHWAFVPQVLEDRCLSSLAALEAQNPLGDLCEEPPHAVEAVAPCRLPQYPGRWRALKEYTAPAAFEETWSEPAYPTPI